MSADNVFATGTAAEIQLVSRLNLKKFSLDSKIIKLLIEKYKIIKSICPPSVNDLKQYCNRKENFSNEMNIEINDINNIQYILKKNSVHKSSQLSY